MSEANIGGNTERSGQSRPIMRVRVKRVNAGRLNMQNVLQGWTSLTNWDGDIVLQEFDLFNEDDFELDTDV